MSGDAGGGHRYPDSPSEEAGDPVDQWFKRLGRCGICGRPGVDQRHRIIEAIADRVKAGEGEDEVAADYDVPVEAVRACLEWTRAHPEGVEGR